MPLRTRLIFVLGLLTAFGPFSTDMYLPSFPALARDLNASEMAVQATLSTFLLGLALGQLVVGPLADRHGRRMPLLLGIVLEADRTAETALVGALVDEGFGEADLEALVARLVQHVLEELC